MKSKKDFFIVDVSIQKIEDKLYKVVLYRDKSGNLNFSKTIYNPAQYKPENRSTFTSVVNSIEKGYNHSMSKYLESQDDVIACDRYTRQLQSYAEKLCKSIAKNEKELPESEVDNLAVEKIEGLTSEFFGENPSEADKKALNRLVKDTSNVVFKRSITSYLNRQAEQEMER